MSGLSMRTRIITVAVSGAIVAPFALVGGSANAVEAPVVGDVTNVDGLLGGLPAGDLLGTVTGTAGTVTGTAGGATGATGLDPVGVVTDTAANPTGVTETVDALLGDVVDTSVLETVTDLVDLEEILETVTELVDVDKIIKTVTDLVGKVTDVVNLNDVLKNVPVKVNQPSGEVLGATKTKKVAKETVSAGSLPQTGGNADLTALLLCAGLAVAGTGVTLVTRRRNSILGAA